MADELELKLLIEDPEKFERHRKSQGMAPLDFSNIDLSGHDLSGRTLTKCTLQSARLDNVVLKGALLCESDLTEASLVGADLSHTDLLGSKLVRVNLYGATLDHAKIHSNAKVCPTKPPRSASGAHFSGSSCDGGNFRGTQFDKSSFTSVGFHGANLERTSWREANLNDVAFDEANLERADFFLAKISHVRFHKASLAVASYLFGPNKADIDGEIKTEDVRHGMWIDRVTWEGLRWIGQFRLFAVSYSSFFAIVLYILAADWYNTSVTALASSLAGSLGTALPVVPLPPRLGFQMFSLLGMAIASTIFELRCPVLVKEYSETRWTRELANPLLEYRSAKFSYFLSRYTCFALYVFGGGFTVINVGRYLQRAILLIYT